MRQIRKHISIILLKDKTKYKISRHAGEKVQEKLDDIKNHLFIFVPELDITINSDQIKLVKNEDTMEWIDEKDSEPKLSEKQMRENIDRIAKEINEKFSINK